MPRLAIPALIATLCLSLPAMAAVELADGIKDLAPEIRQYLEKTAAGDSGEAVVPYVSEAIRGDIDGDGKQDTFVAFSMPNPDGGNFTSLHQALFIDTSGKQVLRAERANGSTGTAQGISFVPQRIEAGRIAGIYMGYAPDDGACCPSRKWPGQILFRDGKLIEEGAP
ncbi:hypothetical protein [Tahibacter sp.]|uniref:hypothetical protein n=1 Tax=Tahibacter sp. TaxID=2056211 RepID=UPI0028C4DD16|nr:hypothetical protein [Tahibacter sp.]